MLRKEEEDNVIMALRIEFERKLLAPHDVWTLIMQKKKKEKEEQRRKK